MRCGRLQPVLDSMGLAAHLRKSGHALSQEAFADLAVGQYGGFTSNAGTALGHLAVAALALDAEASSDVATRMRALFDRKPALSDDELAVLRGNSVCPLLIEERTEVWERIAARHHIISAARALDLVHELTLTGGPLDLQAARAVIEARNAVVHLSARPRAVMMIVTDFVRAAESLWSVWRKPPNELWGPFQRVVDRVDDPNCDDLTWDTACRISRASWRWYEYGHVANSYRTGLAQPADRAMARPCPACPATAQLQERATNGPDILRPWNQNEAPLLVLSCLVCGLELYGRTQLLAASVEA